MILWVVLLKVFLGKLVLQGIKKDHRKRVTSPKIEKPGHPPGIRPGDLGTKGAMVCVWGWVILTTYLPSAEHFGVWAQPAKRKSTFCNSWVARWKVLMVVCTIAPTNCLDYPGFFGVSGWCLWRGTIWGFHCSTCGLQSLCGHWQSHVEVCDWEDGPPWLCYWTSVLGVGWPQRRVLKERLAHKCTRLLLDK